MDDQGFGSVARAIGRKKVREKPVSTIAAKMTANPTK
jgi:hypothetical protein